MRKMSLRRDKRYFVEEKITFEQTGEDSMEKLEMKYPIISDMKKGKEVAWFNPNKSDFTLSPEVSASDIEEAHKRLERFAPYIQKVFPETRSIQGIIESPLKEIFKMKEAMQPLCQKELRGRLLLKCDSHLPISGSIKARGGIYEVLTIAESIAIEHGGLTKDHNYCVLADKHFKNLFSKYSISVGSTGNLGLSIGIMSAMLGFRVSVHMSSDARSWKKEMLRSKGVTVVEYDADYEVAVAGGRKQAEEDHNCYFIDDENSKTLFLGYSVAAKRLEKQLASLSVTVDAEHPLFVYLPCGVGGGPGGVAYGLKQVFGEHVHCFFAEPVQAPCMLLGVMTGLYSNISVGDIGLSGRTAADGLAVGRASQFVGKMIGKYLDGIFTVTDDRLFKFISTLAFTEHIEIEPSAAAGFHGYIITQTDSNYLHNIGQHKLNQSTHVVWATGGSMVPPQEMKQYIERGKSLY